MLYAWAAENDLFNPLRRDSPMRFFFGLLLLCFCSSSIAAQEYPTDRGSFLIGGAFEFSSRGGDLYEDEDENRESRIVATPTLQYFILPGLAAGINASFARAAQDESAFSQMRLGPVLSFHLGSQNTSVVPFIALSPLYIRLTSEFDNESESNTGFAFQAMAGLEAFVARNVAISFGGFYLSESIEVEFFNETDTFSGTTFGLQVGVTAFVW